MKLEDGSGFTKHTCASSPKNRNSRVQKDKMKILLPCTKDSNILQLEAIDNSYQTTTKMSGQS